MAPIRRRCGRCARRFPGEYWRKVDRERLSDRSSSGRTHRSGIPRALIPEDTAAGLGIAEAAIILEEINRGGGNAGACHAQMYTMGTLLRHGSAEQKHKLAAAASPAGELRLLAFGVTESTSGSDTSACSPQGCSRRRPALCRERPEGLISRAEHSDLLLWSSEHRLSNRSRSAPRACPFSPGRHARRRVTGSPSGRSAP